MGTTKKKKSLVKMEDPVDMDVDDSVVYATAISNMNGNGTDAPMSIDADNSNDDNDEIIREIDVFISPELARNMHLIQFPLTPASNTGPRNETTLKPSTPLSARVKPQHAILELEYDIPSSSFSKQRQIPTALNLNTRTFSSQNIPLTTHMALGVFDNTGNRIDLIPLHRVMQMRPTMKHVDDFFRSEDNSNHEINYEDDEIKEKEIKPIMFKKQENERAVLARQSSFAYKRACEAEEDWIDLKVYQSGSEEHRKETMKAHCSQNVRDKTLRFVKAGKVGGIAGYVKSLNYLPGVMNKEDTDDIIPTLDSKSSDEWMKDLTVRVANLLQAKQGLPVSYPVIRSKFKKNISDHALIQAISASASLVRGNFVLKSSLMAVSKPVANARDVVLILFMKYGIVQRELVKKVYELSGDDSVIVTADVVNSLFDMLGRKTVNGMEMKLDDDFMFENQFHEAARLHEMYWQKREDKVKSYIQKYTQLSQYII